MRRIEIYLSEPFEEVLTTLLTLPSTLAETDHIQFIGLADSAVNEGPKCAAEVKEALRSLYEAAHGRQVETQIGFLAIAPPIAGFLKAKPYYVATQYEFFLEAFTRILAGDSPRNFRTRSSRKPGGEHVLRHGRIDIRNTRPKREDRPARFIALRQDCDQLQITRP
jgi:hypothetical protein